MIYVLYESYNDNITNKKILNSNTKIIGIFNDEEKGIEYINKYVESIITNNEDEFNWFYKETETLTLNDNVVVAYDIFNEEIGNYEEHYVVILERVGEIKNE